jgi:Ca-activated chloride channel family protein
MTFAYPIVLLLLLALPLLAWLRGRRGQPPAFVYSSLQLVRPVLSISRGRPGRLLLALRWLTLALLIVAVAQPRLTRSETKVTASGVDIAVALDMSGSMAAEDFEIAGGRVNRLQMAKAVLTRFIEKRPNDRIGLVVFGTDAYVAAPLTLDHEFLLKNVERLDFGAIDDSRTAVGSALSTAVNRVRELKSKSKIVILMTDGQNNSGSIEPLTAAEAAQALKIKVYTIGVGTRGVAPMPQYLGGRKYYVQQQVDIDEATLKKIAELTKGEYYRADNARTFASIYDEIDKLEKSEAEVKKYAHHNELFLWFILVALGLALLEIALRHTVFRRLP